LTTDHVTACPILAKRTVHKETECAQICFNICMEIGVKLNNEHWHKTVLKLVEKVRQLK